MAQRRFSILAALAAAGLAAVSCVYPFNPDIKGGDGTLVIEGDILIGEDCTFSLSYTADFDDAEQKHPAGEVWVEDNNGNKYMPHATSAEDGTYQIDLTSASDDSQYRLCAVNKDNGHEYESDWKSVCKAASIDSLNYMTQHDKNRLAIGLSMHTTGNKYFRWSYTEDWEYHSFYYATMYYLVTNKNMKQGMVMNFENGENHYYCWDKDVSHEIMIFSTAEQTEDRFVDLEFHVIPQTSMKLQALYYIEVSLEALDEDGYKYWNNLLQTSENQGNFFSPTPSQMLGNIKCTTDPSEYVQGYISAARRSKAHMYYNNSLVHFYESATKSYPDLTMVADKDTWSYYIQDYVPVMEVLDDTGELGIGWAPIWCSDCRYQGGTKDKPDFWPNNHI